MDDRHDVTCLVNPHLIRISVATSPLRPPLERKGSSASKEARRGHYQSALLPGAAARCAAEGHTSWTRAEEAQGMLYGVGRTATAAAGQRGHASASGDERCRLGRAELSWRPHIAKRWVRTCCHPRCSGEYVRRSLYVQRKVCPALGRGDWDKPTALRAAGRHVTQRCRCSSAVLITARGAGAG
jgi:hypothetical protein